MDGKRHLVANIYEKLRTYGDFRLYDVDIYDDENCGGESHKTERIFINEDNIAMVELDNGDVIDIEELDYNELIAIYEELV